jgi:hypothetical protein
MPETRKYVQTVHDSSLQQQHNALQRTTPPAAAASTSRTLHPLQAEKIGKLFITVHCSSSNHRHHLLQQHIRKLSASHVASKHTLHSKMFCPFLTFICDLHRETTQKINDPFTDNLETK